MGLVENTDVAVIGAGPAGLSVGACLKKAGVNFIIVEKNNQVGSSWRQHYERLHLHTIKQLSSLPYLPFPRHYPRYVPRNLMIEYLEGYAANFDLKPRFGEAARSVHREGSAWTIDTVSSSICASYVVIASGLNNEPVMLSVPGMEKYKGKAIHSADYVNSRPFAGQSVLVIGMGNTGAEIALDLSEAGARPTISLRDGVHVVPRDLFGVPIQVVATLASSVLPVSANDILFPPILDLALGNLAKYGIRRPQRGILRQVADTGKIPVLDIGTVRKISEGVVKIEPRVSAITEDGAVFEGGHKGSFDAIIFATGYRPNYRSFLKTNDASTFHDGTPNEKSRNSAIYFVGFRNPVSGLLREISKEAIRVADHIVRQRN
jgi:cation diffusion facilitator CzcD-associated flavoprotein CzcO